MAKKDTDPLFDAIRAIEIIMWENSLDKHGKPSRRVPPVPADEIIEARFRKMGLMGCLHVIPAAAEHLRGALQGRYPPHYEGLLIMLTQTCRRIKARTPPIIPRENDLVRHLVKEVKRPSANKGELSPEQVRAALENYRNGISLSPRVRLALTYILGYGSKGGNSGIQDTMREILKNDINLLGGVGRQFLEQRGRPARENVFNQPYGQVQRRVPKK